jgi:hypothetical protein
MQGRVVLLVAGALLIAVGSISEALRIESTHSWVAYA